MSIKALADYTQYSKYARYLPGKKRRETWAEQVDRVFQMHEEKFGSRLDNIREDFEFTKSMVKQKKILGSQRALQFGGKPILDKPAKMYNCTVSYVDRPRFFQECMYLLLCGCGTGFSVQTHHVAKLPDVRPRNEGSKLFVIPDTIEGWADAIGVLMSSYFVGQDNYVSHEYGEIENYSGFKVEFDYSQIRPAGAPISWGGKAPGPEGLQRSIAKIEELLDGLVESGETRLRAIDAYDVVMHASDAVLSGGIRRSATICLFSPDDDEMANAKTGDWFTTNPQRGRSNNSALLIRNETTPEQFSKLMTSVKEFGEPGFVWSDDKEALYNPCVEIGMRAYSEDGESGWQFCLTGDTKIEMADGSFKQIKDLVGNECEIVSQYSSDKLGHTDTISNSHNKAFVVETGVKDVFEVNTVSGPSIKATGNHMLLTQRGYVRVDELKLDEDYLVSSMSTDNTPLYDVNGICSDYEPNDFDLLGWNLGDGWCSGNSSFGLVFGSREDDLAETKLVPLFESLINSTDGGSYGNRYGDVEFDIDYSNDGVRCYSSSNSSKRKVICEKWGIGVGKSDYKTIMNSYWNASVDDKARYLSAWFSADGSVINNNGIKRVSITIASETLANDLQIALTQFGIVSRVTHHSRLRDGKNQSILYIGSESDITIFKNKIGFRLHPRKQADLVEMSWDKKGTLERGLFKIKSIQHVGVETVYDMTVEDTHNFKANGLVVHNCNLCEINGRKARTEEEFIDQCRAAAVLGTLQAAYDTFEYLTEASNRIVQREALLGVSMTGMMDSPDIIFDPEIQKRGAQLILDINSRISKEIGINECARATCVKPAGTTSCILGTSSGVHPHHAKRYMRRVQANKLEFPAQVFQEANPAAVEESVWSNNGTDVVLTFLCEVPDGAKTKNQVDALSLLEHVKLTQQNWVEAGTRYDKLAAPWLRHNVSNTINVKPNEWDEVEQFIYANRDWFAGISLLPQSGDLDYPQAPFTTVLTENEIVKTYGKGALFASGLIVDGLHAFNGNLWAACDCAIGIGEPIDYERKRPSEPHMPHKNGYNDKEWAKKLVDYASKLNVYHTDLEKYENVQMKIDWIRRFQQFADRYCDGDTKSCTHMLKHVHNRKLWLDLQRQYKDIDWSQVEEEWYELDVSTISGEACAGGKCELGELGKAIEENLSKQPA
jgi:hypothetical protein